MQSRKKVFTLYSVLICSICSAGVDGAGFNQKNIIDLLIEQDYRQTDGKWGDDELIEWMNGKLNFPIENW